MEGGREGGSIYFCFYLYFIFVLEKKTKREGGTRSLSFLREKIPAPSVHASERDTASTLTASLRAHTHAHTHTHVHTYPRDLQLVLWKEPPLILLLSIQYTYNPLTIHHMHLFTSQQTDQSKLTRHNTTHQPSVPWPTYHHCTNLSPLHQPQSCRDSHLVPDMEW